MGDILSQGEIDAMLSATEGDDGGGDMGGDGDGGGGDGVGW